MALLVLAAAAGCAATAIHVDHGLRAESAAEAAVVEGAAALVGARFAAEMRRVCIPGGTIVLVNHFMSENWALRFCERRLARVARHIGFHPDFEFDRFMRDSKLTLREIRPSNLFGYWRLLRCVNEKDASTLN